jgi:hypothetical protein
MSTGLKRDAGVDHIADRLQRWGFAHRERSWRKSSPLSGALAWAGWKVLCRRIFCKISAWVSLELLIALSSSEMTSALIERFYAWACKRKMYRVFSYKEQNNRKPL